MERQVLVIGAGAAGLVAAIVAAQAGAEVTLLERTADGGRKILISGGGRCNILPSELEPHRFVSDSSARLVRAVLRSWPLEQQRRFFVDEVGVPLALEEATGKWFPVSNRARDVRDGLLRHARRLGVRLVTETLVTALEPRAEGWRVAASRGELTAAAVVLATGGLSVPMTGSDGSGLRIATSLGLAVHPTYPALTPLLSEAAPHAPLSGVSAVVRMRARDEGTTAEARGGFLFTHRGYSGPAVLDVSHVAVRARERGGRASLRVRWSEHDAASWERELIAAPGPVIAAVSRQLPQRLAAALLDEAGVPLDRRGPELRRDERTALIDRLCAYPLVVSGDEGYKKAEVTGGGLALEAFDGATLESRAHRGLFVCGELLDAFGPIGGYNFAWAWASGRLAGRGAAARVRQAAG